MVYNYVLILRENQVDVMRGQNLDLRLPIGKVRYVMMILKIKNKYN